MILIDTSGLLSALFSDQRHHEACAEALREAEPPLVLSPFVLAEIDYLITKYAGVDAELEFLADVAAGAYEIASFGNEDVAAATQVIDRYRDLNVGLADASIVVLAERHGTSDVLTLDECHFRSLRTGSGRTFRLLPADG
ncbi:MAG: PIN domain-containing protein [Actinomycetota bacterium]